jgi:hypothetical protein
MPSLSPTLTGMIGSAFGAALPTVSVAAVAGVHPAMIDLPHLSSGVLVAIAPTNTGTLVVD